MIRSARFLTALAPLLFTAACGLKGPLYLPDESKEEVAAPASEESDNTTQSQKKDRALGEPSVSLPDPDRPAEPQPDR